MLLKSCKESNLALIQAQLCGTHSHGNQMEEVISLGREKPGCDSCIQQGDVPAGLFLKPDAAVTGTQGLWKACKSPPSLTVFKVLHSQN